MLFCVGNFFGDDNKEWEAVKSGELKGTPGGCSRKIDLKNEEKKTFCHVH